MRGYVSWIEPVTDFLWISLVILGYGNGNLFCLYDFLVLKERLDTAEVQW